MGVLTQNYEIVRELGRGGMGAVYLANDKRLDRPVAIKMLQVDHSLDNATAAEIIQRFQKEAKAIAKLNHPNIVSIYDIGEENNQYYMVIELLEGQALSNILEKGKRLSVSEVIEVGVQICSALAYAHRNGIVHRDIKPANIMFSPEKIAKLTDFGIAQLGNDKLALTQAGSILGSILYIPPEQLIDSRNVDNRADIYSLGVTLFQLLTGRLPFEGEAVAEVITKILNQDIPSTRKFDPSIPEALDKVILKALKKEPNERYQEVSQLGSALSEVADLIKNNGVKQGTAPLISETRNDIGTNTQKNISSETVMLTKTPDLVKPETKSPNLSVSHPKTVNKKVPVKTPPPKTQPSKKKENSIPLVIGGLTLGIIALVAVLAMMFGGEPVKNNETVTAPLENNDSKPEQKNPVTTTENVKKTGETVNVKPAATVKPVAKATVKPVAAVTKPQTKVQLPASKPVSQSKPQQKATTTTVKKPVSKPVSKPQTTKPAQPEPKKYIGEGY